MHTRLAQRLENLNFSSFDAAPFFPEGSAPRWWTVIVLLKVRSESGVVPMAGNYIFWIGIFKDSSDLSVGMENGIMLLEWVLSTGLVGVCRQSDSVPSGPKNTQLPAVINQEKKAWRVLKCFRFSLSPKGVWSIQRGLKLDIHGLCSMVSWLAGVALVHPIWSLSALSSCKRLYIRRNSAMPDHSFAGN